MSTAFEDLILRDITANRPAAGKPGRLFFDTTLGKMQRDNGSSWDDVEGTNLTALLTTFSLQGDISPAQITSNQNDYNPTGLSTATVLRLNTDASRNITSLQGGADGRIIVIVNVGSFNIVLKDDDGSTGTAGNRFALSGDITLAADDGVILQYDSTSSRWRCIGKSPGGAGGAIYPQDVFIPIHQFKIVAGGFTWSGTTDTGQEFNTQFFQSSPADSNAIQTTVMLKADTYDVYVLGITANNRGKIDWSMDGINFISAQDWYNGTTQQNITKTGTVTIAASGRHILKATINGKNASSSNYYMVITAIWLNAQSQTTET